MGVVGWGREELLVEEDIGVFMFLEFELSLETFVLPTEPVFLEFGVFGFLDELVVVAVPFVVGVDEGVVVSAL